MTELQVHCPFCGSSVDFRFYPQIDVCAQPALKREVISGRIFHVHCTACRRRAVIGYPLEYVDPSQGLRLHVMPQGIMPQSMPDDMPLCRVVHQPDALSEKITIFDAGLDDRPLQILKLALTNTIREEKQLPDALLHLTREGDSLVFTVSSQHLQGVMTAPFDEEMYRKVAERFTPFMSAGFRDNLEVDRKWAQQMLTPQSVLQ